ncbi:MAG: hybrid sensor histidine kinase/response regulator [Lacunisphaera sp.]|nr:hybrid sensor histidine kinase/response regulator [Lacunisphaera sp.]MDB6165213.1 hybrid sensor histidine kinase/response regulator [Lacunisphaera sp.]
MASTPDPLPPLRVLHLEDNSADAELSRVRITEAWPTSEIKRVDNRADFIAALDAQEFDLVLSDFSLPAFNGLEALDLVRERGMTTPFLFLSGTMGEDYAVEALRRGAVDYVIKDRPARLIAAMRSALEGRQEQLLRRKAEHRIREQADLLNRARDAIVVADPGNHITFWNHGAERLMGWTAAETLGRTVEEVFGLGASPRLAELRQTLAETGSWQGELKAVAKAGNTVIMQTHSTLIRDDAGEPTARFHIITDITEKKQLQEQLLRVQRLESIGMLASGIAHDLNNVLTPILMAAPMLRQRATDPLDLRLLETLEHSAERGAALVRQILSFAHGTAGEPRLMQVKHLARDIVEMIEETFPKSIALEQHFAADTRTIRANPTQIHQVLLNLCVNARDAMPQGGTLWLRTENRELDSALAAAIPGARPGIFVVIEVEDSGTGIPPEALTHVWEPFFTTKGEGKGTGLGLSTVRGIVETHRGFIELHTRVGHGTTFRIYLPAAEVDEKVEGAVALPSAPRGTGELILLVDDEATNRDVTRATLARHGYRVLVAANGTEAVALFVPRSEEIRLVISDLGMPNMDGAALTRILQRLTPGVRILTISGFASDAGRSAGDVGPAGSGFLAKPFKAEALLRKVHALLQPGD